MKNLLSLIFIGLILAGLNANASIDIKSIELLDSTIIDGAEVSVITIKNNDSTIESVETTGGDIIQGHEVKKVHISKPFGYKEVQSFGAKLGGEGSGG